MKLSKPQRQFIERLRSRGGKAHVYELAVDSGGISTAGRLADTLATKGMLTREKSGVLDLQHLRSRDVLTLV